MLFLIKSDVLKRDRGRKAIQIDPRCKGHHAEGGDGLLIGLFCAHTLGCFCFGLDPELDSVVNEFCSVFTKNERLYHDIVCSLAFLWQLVCMCCPIKVATLLFL